MFLVCFIAQFICHSVSSVGVAGSTENCDWAYRFGNLVLPSCTL